MILEQCLLCDDVTVMFVSEADSNASEKASPLQLLLAEQLISQQDTHMTHLKYSFEHEKQCWYRTVRSGNSLFKITARRSPRGP